MTSDRLIPNSEFTPHPTPFLHCQLSSRSVAQRLLSTVNCQPITNHRIIPN
ncbi:hypothetical protein [Chroococcidiopsis sp.]|uniref:hypothetical protein n=1 Tax=Chroococcidiopsis sp. TaxID=3088168 RepID=UPI003F3D0557